jgi:acyl-CoA thioester hydrolase
VRPEWIDYNGHMNVAFYVLAFDYATDALMDHIGMDEAYRKTTQCSFFTLEMHVNYLQELQVNDPLRCTTQLLDFDAKKIHYFHAMYHAEQGNLAATSELLILHMDMVQRRSTPIRPHLLSRVEAIMASHRQLPCPPQVGCVIGIRRKAAS